MQKIIIIRINKLLLTIAIIVICSGKLISFTQGNGYGKDIRKEIKKTKIEANQIKIEGSNKINLNSWSATVSFGSNLFYGDLRVYDFYPVKEYNNERKWAYGITLNKQFTPLFGLQGHLLMGNLAGTKRPTADELKVLKINSSKNDTNDYRYFDASIFEYSLVTTISISKLFYPDKTGKLNVYAMGGIGLVDFRTVKKSLSDDSYISGYGYSDNGTVKEKMVTEVVVPVGLGMKYNISRKIDIGLEMTLRHVNSDKLDAEIVDNSRKDKYGYTNIGLTYRFGKGNISVPKF